VSRVLIFHDHSIVVNLFVPIAFVDLIELTGVLVSKSPRFNAVLSCVPCLLVIYDEVVRLIVDERVKGANLTYKIKLGDLIGFIAEEEAAFEVFLCIIIGEGQLYQALGLD